MFKVDPFLSSSFHGLHDFSAKISDPVESNVFPATAFLYHVQTDERFFFAVSGFNPT